MDHQDKPSREPVKPDWSLFSVSLHGLSIISGYYYYYYGLSIISGCYCTFTPWWELKVREGSLWLEEDTAARLGGGAVPARLFRRLCCHNELSEPCGGFPVGTPSTRDGLSAQSWAAAPGSLPYSALTALISTTGAGWEGPGHFRNSVYGSGNPLVYFTYWISEKRFSNGLSKSIIPLKESWVLVNGSSGLKDWALQVNNLYSNDCI